MKNSKHLNRLLCLLLLALAVGVNFPMPAMAVVPRETTDKPAPDNTGGGLADYTVGVFLLESGSPQAAVPHLEAAWEKSAHDATIGEKLAEAYFSVGDFPRCETVLDELLVEDENSHAALLLKAKVAYLRSRKEEAVTYLEKLETVHEPTFEVQRILAKVYVELGRESDAIDAYATAIHLDSNYPRMHYEYGLLLRNAGRGDEAIEAFTNAVRLNPGFSEAAIDLAAILIDRGEQDEAEAVLVRLLEADPTNYDAMRMTADIYIEQGQLDKAIKLLETANQQSRLPAEGVLLLGRLYYEVKDYDEALKIFKGLFDSGHPTPELARVLGEISARSGNTEEALVHYRRAIELGPRDYRNHLALFLASSSTFTVEESQRIKLTDEENAQLLDEAARVVQPDDFDGLYLIGISYQSIESLKDAREFLVQAAALEPEDERVLLNLASVLEKLEEYVEAEQYLIVLHTKQPDDPTTCNFYGYLLAVMGKDLDRAEKLIGVALDDDPENGYYIDSLGWVYYKKGAFDKALEQLQRASSIVGDDPTILEHLGDIYLAMERHGDALEAYERSRGLQGDTPELMKKIDETQKFVESK